ncbi:tetratricopeptide repeat protein [Lysobacter ciconiae]|uniref:Tetratricopeptide repeat protein n=1 Tax=Novilysobacter ciconiae TaxID=2781022 RepID=A0A7S6UE06_9GAMM|nr:tetratricopeptide repeat protein [Lysobacter ciconiae]QOW18531.1 tetratricopeptide repeat protein [Lysobacter ciconiae]
MKQATDTRGRSWVLGVALLALAGSGCATLAAGAAPGYADSMTAAETAMRGDDAAAAIQAYQRAADAAPGQTLPWLHIAEIHAGLGDWSQAVTAARQVLDRDPQVEEARDLYLRGSVQLVEDALQYLPEEDSSGIRDMAGALLARLIRDLGDEAIPVDVRARLESGVQARPRRSGARPGTPRQAPRGPEKTTADPLEVLGGG